MSSPFYSYEALPYPMSGSTTLLDGLRMNSNEILKEKENNSTLKNHPILCEDNKNWYFNINDTFVLTHQLSHEFHHLFVNEINKIKQNQNSLVEQKNNDYHPYNPFYCVSLIGFNSIEILLSYISISSFIPFTAISPLNPSLTYEEYLFYFNNSKPYVILLVEDNLPEKQQEIVLKAAHSYDENVPVAFIKVSQQSKNNNNLTQMKVKDSNNNDVILTSQYSISVSLHNPKSKQSGLSSNITSVLCEYNSVNNPSDVGFFFYSSGSTGKPKGIPLTHKNIYFGMDNTSNVCECNSNDVLLMVLPHFHVLSLFMVLSLIRFRSLTVILPKFSNSNFYEKAFHHNITCILAVPSVYQLLLNQLDEMVKEENGDKTKVSTKIKNKLPNLRWLRSASAPMSATIWANLEFYFNVPILQSYGCTEAMVMVSNRLQKQKMNSVGIPTKNCKAKLVKDEESGNMEVVISGPSVFHGYFNIDNQIQENKKKFYVENDTYWYRTGDCGYFDEDNFLFLNGRINEFINRGGEKISPFEIENATQKIIQKVKELHKHEEKTQNDSHGSNEANINIIKDKIKDLVEKIADIVAFGGDDPTYQEIPCLCIVLNQETIMTHEINDLREFLHHNLFNYLSKFKVPSLSNIYICKSNFIQRNAMGKFSRKDVKKSIFGQNDKQ